MHIKDWFTFRFNCNTYDRLFSPPVLISVSSIMICEIFVLFRRQIFVGPKLYIYHRAKSRSICMMLSYLLILWSTRKLILVRRKFLCSHFLTRNDRKFIIILKNVFKSQRKYKWGHTMVMMMGEHWVITRILCYSSWCGLVFHLVLALLFHGSFRSLTLYQS